MLVTGLCVVLALAAAFLARKRRDGRRGRRVAFGVVSAVATLAALLASTFIAAPLPAPPPFAGPAPSAAPQPDVTLVQLPTGTTHRSAAFAYRGGSFFDAREFSMTAVLVRHPRGDVLIDTGFGRDLDRHFAMMPAGFRAVTSYARGVPAADQLDHAHYDRKKLRAILLTHAHWDHTSGLPDFPDTPVWVTAEEHRFVRDGGFLTAVARDVNDARYAEYRFEGGPFLGFPASHDVYGDGAIVVVPAPGHTPGSVVVFVTIATGARYAFVGDLAWQREGITEREERPWLQRTLGDSDPEAARAALLRMDALVVRFPDLVVAPAHESRAFSDIPQL